MDLARHVDIYCERIEPGYWAEPLNAVSNAAFLIAAALMWWRLRGVDAPLARALVWILTAIGIGSYLWHTHAQVWAGIVDSSAIGVFAIVFIFAANRDFWGLRGWKLWVATLAFIPYTVITVPIFNRIPFFEISSGYWPLPLLMLIYGVALRRKLPETARGLLISAALVTLSLTMRSLDEPLCHALPFGTHFLWHGLNGVLLGWMIEVYRRHHLRSLAASASGR